MSRKSGIRAKLKRLRKRLANRRQRVVWLALLYRPIMPHVTYVGVTGSCAKTTTTRLIGAVLKAAGPCRTRDDNGPSHVSRNVLSVGLRTRFCVQEIAGDEPGKIRTQTRILKPQIGVVTNVGGDHYRTKTGPPGTGCTEYLPHFGATLSMALAQRSRSTPQATPQATAARTDVVQNANWGGDQSIERQANAT